MYLIFQGESEDEETKIKPGVKVYLTGFIIV